MPEWLFDFLSGPTIKIAAGNLELQHEADHKAGLQYATKVFYRNMGICQRKPVSVGRGDRTLCSKFIFYDSFFESCE